MFWKKITPKALTLPSSIHFNFFCVIFWFGIWLAKDPMYATFVFSSFIFNPDKHSNRSRVFNDCNRLLLLPSSITVESSADWEILHAILLMSMPERLWFFLIRHPNISAQIKQMKRDKESPCLQPLPNINCFVAFPFTKTGYNQLL